MKFEVSEKDYLLLCAMFNLFREKKGVCRVNPSITKMELIEASGVSNSLLTSKILNSYKRKIEKEENIA